MKRILFTLFAFLVIIASCRINRNKTVKGNGTMTSEKRAFSDLSKIKVRGGINVEVAPGASDLRVEADENLLKYIETREENGWLVVKTRDNVNVRSNHPIRVVISTEKIQNVNIAGSGNLKGLGKFNGGSMLDIDVAGSGNVTLDVNTPTVNVDIRGSGTVTLSGETRDASIDIAGSGDYIAQDLLTENTKIEIVGSGDARVFADNRLDTRLIGSGTVYYRGKATVYDKGGAGSGKVKQL